MRSFAAFAAQGRSVLLGGGTTFDRPPVEGSRRWGAAAVLRPSGPMLERLAELAAELAPVVGEGHWIHGTDALHVTLRSLEPYRREVAERRVYGAALAAAARDLPPVRVELRGVSPHHGGVLVWGVPVDDTLVTLQKRFGHELGTSGAFENWARDIWYVSLAHFASPVTTPDLIAAWCDERAGLTVGVAELDCVEIAQAVHTGAGMRLVTLESVTLG
ncbi:2'-5' RNA ligase family protein [Nonomuraea sp. NPDC049152]|uniref:2'-5' RNA ligase family protein n=1 Tax=Nonomuraea sp. NPDC049152 TaxID=3154350 RepID=UPI0033C28E6E